MQAKQQIEITHCDQCGEKITTFQGKLTHDMARSTVTLKICKCWFIFIDQTNGVFIQGRIQDFLTKQPQNKLQKLILQSVGGD